MKLTQKDKEFIENLKALCGSKDLSVEMVDGGLKRLVLRQNYGDKIELVFKISRQGVRWRFQRLFNEIYVSAHETIYFIESLFGAQLRKNAIEIAQQRVKLRKQAIQNGFVKKVH